MFRMNGTPRAQGCAGAVCVNFAHCLTQGCAGAACVNFAQSLSICMGAEVARYLSSGLATSTSLWARSRHPCRSRSGSKVPHTLCAVRNYRGMVSDRSNLTPVSVVFRAHLSESTVSNLPTEPRGCGPCFRTVRDRSRERAPMDGFTACPETGTTPPWLPS